MARGSTRQWLVITLVAGGLLRLSAIWFGLPYLLARPDEDVATGKAAAMLITGDPNPHFFHWPSLTLYLFAGIYAVAGALKAAISLDQPLTPFEQILVARVVVALAGTATLLVVFRIGRRVADETTGLIAAALLAVAILHVRESHFAMTDVLMTFLVTSSLALLLRAVDEKDQRRSLPWFAAAGFAGGLAVSTKYSGAAIVASQLVIFFSRTSRSFLAREAWLPSVAFGALLLVGFMVTTPYALLDYSAFEEGFRFTFSHLAAGQNVSLGRGWTYHPTHSLPFGLGLTTFAAAVAGIVVMARHHRLHGLVLGSFAAMLYVSIGSGYLVFFRYVLPLLPIACLAAALAVRHSALWLAKHTALRHGVILGVLTAVTVGPGLINSVWLNVVLARTDSRMVAASWLEGRLQPGETLYDAGGRYVALDLSRVNFRRAMFDKATDAFTVPEDGMPDWLVLHESPLFTYTEVPLSLQSLARRDYVLVKSVEGTPSTSRGAIYDVQDLFFLPLWGMWTVERPGPTVHIYRRMDPR